MSDKGESNTAWIGQITEVIRTKVADLSDELKTKKLRLKVKDEELKAKVDESRAKDYKLKAKDDKMKAKDEELKTKDEELKAKDEELKTKDDKLKVKDEELKTKDDKLMVKDEELKTKDDKLKAKDDKLKAKDKDLKAKTAELKVKDTTLNLKTQEADSLFRQLNSEKANNHNLQEALENQKVKVSDLCTQLNTKDTELNNMSAQVNSLVSQLSNAQADTSHFQSQAADLCTQLKDKTAELTLKTEEADSSRQQLDKAKTDNHRLQKALEEQKAKVSDLCTMMKAKDTELNEKTAKLDSLCSVQADNHRLREELEKQEARADLLKVKDEVLITEPKIKMEPEPLEQEVAVGVDERSSRKRHQNPDLIEPDENESKIAKSSSQPAEDSDSVTMSHLGSRTPIIGASMASAKGAPKQSEVISAKDPAGSRSNSVTKNVSYKIPKSRDRARSGSQPRGRGRDALLPPRPPHPRGVLRFTAAGMTVDEWAEAETRDLERQGVVAGDRVRQHLEKELVERATFFMPIWWRTRLYVPPRLCSRCGDTNHREKECRLSSETKDEDLCTYSTWCASTKHPHLVAFCKELHSFCPKCFRYGHGRNVTVCPRDAQADREKWHRYKARGYYTKKEHFEYEPSQKEIAKQVDFIFGSFAQTLADADAGFRWSHASSLWSKEQHRCSSLRDPPRSASQRSASPSATLTSTSTSTSAGERANEAAQVGPDNAAGNGVIFTQAQMDFLAQMILAKTQ